jgi:hypothetical protein
MMIRNIYFYVYAFIYIHRDHIDFYVQVNRPLRANIMFTWLFFLLVITCWFQVNCYVPVPIIYKQVDNVLRRYSSRIDCNPLVYALLNVLVNDRRVQAFISPETIEFLLQDIGESNRHDEHILRELLIKPMISNELTSLPWQLKEHILALLDRFFTSNNIDDYDIFQFELENRHIN